MNGSMDKPRTSNGRNGRQRTLRPSSVILRGVIPKPLVVLAGGFMIGCKSSGKTPKREAILMSFGSKAGVSWSLGSGKSFTPIAIKTLSLGVCGPQPWARLTLPRRLNQMIESFFLSCYL